MYKLGKLRLLKLLGTALALCFLAPSADAAYSWGTVTLYQDKKVVAYGRGSVSGQFLKINSSATVRRAGNLNGRGVYAHVSAWQIGRNGNAFNFRHPNTNSTSYTTTTRSGVYGSPTWLTWNANAKVCVDVAWWYDTCSGSTAAGGGIY